MLVYDWADGELLGVPRDQRDDPASTFQRFRRLPVERVLACLDTIVDVHDRLGEAGEVAGDFYDGCLLYDFAAHRVSLIDLDRYRPGPHTNHMGRMFGSTRFMAPEEFSKGATIDQRTSVFTMGRTVLVLLSDGTTSPDAFRGPPALLEVACPRLPSAARQSPRLAAGFLRRVAIGSRPRRASGRMRLIHRIPRRCASRDRRIRRRSGRLGREHPERDRVEGGGAPGTCGSCPHVAS